MLVVLCSVVRERQVGRGVSKPGYIYVATQQGSPGMCKIGQTIDVSRRELTLKGAVFKAQVKIIEYAHVSDMDAVEGAFQKILEDKRMEGEWFNVEVANVLPMLKCVGNMQGQPQEHEVEIHAPSRTNSRRGEWHEDGWKMHCRGETQARIAERFGVSEGAVIAMKRKMRASGRRHEEADRRRRFLGRGVVGNSTSGRRHEEADRRPQSGTASVGRQRTTDVAPSRASSGRGEWHEDGWKMHCRGETQARIAERFGVSEGAVVAMKKKMRTSGRRHEEANRQR